MEAAKLEGVHSRTRSGRSPGEPTSTFTSANATVPTEHRPSGKRKYYLSNLAADVPLERLAALIKAHWEQIHQQMKDELGLDHFEGRNWRGLHYHALLCQLAFTFLQHLRLGGKSAAQSGAGPPPRPPLPQVRGRIFAALTRVLLRCPHCRQRFAPSPPALIMAE